MACYTTAEEFQILEKMNISKICVAIIRLHNNLTLHSGMSNWRFSVLLEMRRNYSALWMRVALKSFIARSKVYYFYMIPRGFSGRQKRY